MIRALSIDAEWETLRQGSAEERACFAALGIQYGDIWLTEAEDAFVKRVRSKVHLSAYHFAEWLAWNWWRLRWEPRKHAPGWNLAHRMATIGGGYVWPNVTIFSDGERVVLLAEPSQSRPEEPLRYLANVAAVVRAVEFETVIDQFLGQIRGQLRAEDVADSNLGRIWADVVTERRDPDASAYRKLEALLGFDPDEAEESMVQTLLTDSQDLGKEATNEIAANRTPRGAVLTARELRDAATTGGFDANPRDGVRLMPGTNLSPIGQSPAWCRGAEAAQALRTQQQLGAAPLSNRRLIQLAAVSSETLGDRSRCGADISFALDETPTSGKIVLRSKWETGRRFELARLLGDRIAYASAGRLFPATETYTYRQKLQRSFAAELLCPFEALLDVLGGDVSSEAIQDAADHFTVSPMTIETILVNHGRLERNSLERDFESAAA